MKMRGRRQDQDTEGTQTGSSPRCLRRGALLRGHLSGTLLWRQSMVIEQERWTASLSKTLNPSC